MTRNNNGFTMLELLTIIAVLGILIAASLPTYNYFVRRSQASEILLSYDALRSGLETELALGSVNDCNDLQEAVTVSLGHQYTDLSLGFEAVNGQNSQGYYPVLQVCASSDQQGSLGVEIARGAYQEFDLTNTISPGAVLTGSLVSFSVPTGDSSTSACMVPIPSTASGTGCGQSGQTQTPPANNPPAQQPAQPATQQTISQAQADTAVDTALQTIPQADRQAASDLVALIDSNNDLANALKQALATGTPAGTPGPHVQEFLNQCPGSESNAFDGKDAYLGDCQTDLGANPAGGCQCFVAQVCQVSCGVTQPASQAVVELLRAKHYASVRSRCYGSSISNTFRPSDPSCQELSRLDAERAAGGN